MRRKKDRYLQLYNSLKSHFERKSKFTIQQLHDETGYTPGSLKAYFRNRLRNKFVFEQEDGIFVVLNLENVKLEDFRYLMSQKDHDIVTKNESLSVSLRNRSIQAFYTAIAIYNNPTFDYRVESFCILLCNAWELLLKARIVELNGEKEIYRENGNSISLKRAIEVLFGPTDPVRKNLEVLNEIRDSAVHLLIPELLQIETRIFQSGVFNYLKTIRTYNYPNPFALTSTGLLSIVLNENNIAERVVNIRYGDSFRGKVADFVARIKDQERSIGSADFAVPIGYKVVLTKNEKEGDLSFSVGPDGQSALLIEVAKDHNKTHPYRSTEIIKLVNLEIEPLGKSINQPLFQKILSHEKIRNSTNTPYYYRIDVPLTHKYSKDLKDFIVHKITTNQSYLEDIKLKKKFTT